MPATMDLVLMSAPSRYLTAVKALVTELGNVANLTVIFNVHAIPLMAILEDADNWPDGSSRLAVVSRAGRAVDEPEVRGTTQTEWQGGCVIDVLGRDDSLTTAMDHQDAAEVDCANAVRTVEVATVQEQYDVHLARIVPKSTRDEGAVFPYVASSLEIEVWTHE